MLHLVCKLLINAKKRSLICILGIAVSIMLIFSLAQIGELIIDGYKDAVMNTANYDFYCKELNKECADNMYDKYKDVCYATEVANLASVWESTVLRHELICVKGEWKRLYKTELIDGNDPQGKREICLEESYAKEKGLKIGDSLLLVLEVDGVNFEREFVVSGIVSNLPAYKRGNSLFVSMDFVDDIIIEEERYGNEITFPYVDYMLISDNEIPSAEDIGKIAYDIYKSFGKDVGSQIVYNEHRSQLRDNGGLYFGMRLVLYIIIAFIAVSMIFFIYYVIQVNYWGRMQQYGILQAIGCNNKKLRSILFLEVLIYGVFGYLIGCVLGVILNLVVAKYFVKTFVGLDIKGLYLTPRIPFYVLGILFFSLLIGFMIFAFSIRKMKPIDMIKGINMECRKRMFEGNHFFVDLIVNNCFRNKRVYRGLFITMTFSFLMIIVLGNGLGSVSFDARKTAMSFADMELCVAPDLELLMGKRGFDQQVMDILEDHSKKIYRIGIQRDYGVFNERGETVANILVYSNELMEKLKRYQHIKPTTKVIGSFRENEGINLSKVFIKNENYGFELEIEEYVDFGLTNLAGEAIPGNGYIILDEEYATALFESETKIIDVYLSGCDLSREQLLELFDDDEYLVYDLSATKGTIFSQVQTILILISYMLLAMLLLVVFMITTVAKQNFEMRKKEIGMMLATGIRKKTVMRFLSYEMCLIIGLSCIIAGIIALPVSVYIYYVVNQKIGIGWWGYAGGIPISYILLIILEYDNINQYLRNNALFLIRED